MADSTHTTSARLLTAQDFDFLRPDQFSSGAMDVRAAATDQWPLALLQSRSTHDPINPLAVLWPESTQDVEAIVQRARALNVSIVPYGAGSGVCGGAFAVKDCISVDFKRMRRILSVDSRACVVEAEPGILGSHLEQQLRSQEMTLGHFPSSIMCSSLGGWLAARSAGQFSCRYGKIEDMALWVDAVCGDGKVRRITGRDRELMIGSEGTLGLITGAGLKIWPKPKAEYYRGFSVRSVDHGLEIMRTMLRMGMTPSVLRLYDELDSFIARSKKAHAAAAKHPGITTELLQTLKQRSLAMALRNPILFRMAEALMPNRCTLIIGAEGPERVARQMAEAIKAHCIEKGARDLGEQPGLAWHYGRYHVSYKQSPVFLLGGYVDTLEVSAPWERVHAVYQAVKKALAQRAFIMAHFSHAYLDGCALYFTFGASTEHRSEIEHYLQTINVALTAMMDAGAALSHHHGVGLSKSALFKRHHGALWERFLTLKQRFDPHAIFNPGKLVNASDDATQE